MGLAFVDQYFATARERYQIRLRRLAGQPRPWTTDRQFQQWRFCNVHREHDRTTEWFRDAIRNPANEISALAVTKATIAFRWFNRIETGEYLKPLLREGVWDSVYAKEVLAGVSPVVTGAYIIKGYDGYSKLDGVCKAIDECFSDRRPEAYRIANMVDRWMHHYQGDAPSLERAWSELKNSVNYLGGFMAYEIVSDLRWTRVLNHATDIEFWANAGPGCARGISWVVNGHIEPQLFQVTQKDQKQMLPIMQELLEMSRDPQYWPSDWQPWEMREVEHWSCEFDKYKRAEGGQQMKRRYQ